MVTEIQKFRSNRLMQKKRRKTEKFWQIQKKIGYLYELDKFQN